MDIGSTWVIISSAVIILLLFKIHALHAAAAELEAELSERLTTDTGIPIGISSGDRCMKRLAATLNRELAALRRKRHKYESGDREIKQALTGISHDLRTPLTAMRGYLELLEEEPLTEDGARYAAIVKSRAEMLYRLTEELLDYSLILADEHRGTDECVCINSVLEESLAAFYAAFRARGISPSVELPEERITKTLDRDALTRVLSNVLSNALKYSDGDLDVKMSGDCEITFSNKAAALDEVSVGRLFDRFFTVESAHGSTGLGLSIARSLTSKLNGRIDAHCSNGRLYITLKL